MITHEFAKQCCQKALFNAITGGGLLGEFDVPETDFNVAGVVQLALTEARPKTGTVQEGQRCYARMWAIFESEWGEYERRSRHTLEQER